MMGSGRRVVGGALTGRGGCTGVARGGSRKRYHRLTHKSRVRPVSHSPCGFTPVSLGPTGMLGGAVAETSMPQLLEAEARVGGQSRRPARAHALPHTPRPGGRPPVPEPAASYLLRVSARRPPPQRLPSLLPGPTVPAGNLCPVLRAPPRAATRPALSRLRHARPPTEPEEPCPGQLPPLRVFQTVWVKLCTRPCGSFTLAPPGKPIWDSSPS